MRVSEWLSRDDRSVTVEWAGFSRETFGDPYLVWHDGADFGQLTGRWITESATVATALAMGVTAADPVAAQAIEFLTHQGFDLTSTGAVLRTALDTSTGTFRVRAAQALFALTGDQSLALPICDVLTGAPSQFDRLTAAIALNRFRPEPPVVQALTHGVRDSEYLVRRHSAQSLLALAQRTTTIEGEPGLLEDIRSEHRARWRRAATELAAPLD